MVGLHGVSNILGLKSHKVRLDTSECSVYELEVTKENESCIDC